MEIIEFKDGTLKKQGYVMIDDQEVPIVDSEYEGETPLSAFMLNKLQKNLIENKYELVIDSTKEVDEEITLPCNYKVGQDTLDVYLNGFRLIKSSNDEGEDGHYVEVGDADSISNKIKATSDWNFVEGDVLDLVVRGDWQ